MIVSLTSQLFSFAIAAVIGAAFGVLYDIFKVLRLVGLNSKLLIFIEDILFFLVATVTIFSYYMQITDGKFRIYSLVAAAIGFLIYFLTLERLVFFVIKKIYIAVEKVFGFVYKKIVLRIFRKIKSFFKKLFSPIGKFFKQKFIKKRAVFLKKLLPKTRTMLYNNLRIKKKKKGKISHAPKEQKKSEKSFFC